MQNSLAKLIACIVEDHKMVWDPTPPEIYKLLDFLKDKRLKSRIDSAWVAPIQKIILLQSSYFFAPHARF